MNKWHSRKLVGASVLVALWTTLFVNGTLSESGYITLVTPVVLAWLGLQAAIDGWGKK